MRNQIEITLLEPRSLEEYQKVLGISTSARHVEVVVEDTGPGIPKAERSHVFEKIVRLEESHSRSGNGLSLVAAFASLHKAELILDDASPGLLVIQRFNKV